MGLFRRLRSDLTAVRGSLRTLRMTTRIAREPTRVFPHVIAALAEKFGDAPALVSDGESMSYRELAARANRYARWALQQGIAKGDTICLLMPNRPEFMVVWLGLTQVGGVVALLNTNLTGASLAHCISVVRPKHIIVASVLLDTLASVRAQIPDGIAIWLHGEAGANLPRIDREIEELSGAPLAAAERRELTIEDRALYIYTSGTTGLPKAANINHYRLMLASHGFAGIMDTRPTDRMYDCLPMYHTVGGVVATGAVLLNGGCVVIRDKFSASEFWDDIVRWDCTLFQYIGELCRYLVNAPPQDNETAHRLRLCCGNGLRPDVWPEFERRFRVPQIVEFYAATEGNVSFFNFDGMPGSVGRIPRFLTHRFPTKLIRFDPSAEEPIRDGRGCCIECAADEIGEAIGRIVHDPSKPAARFEGYATPEDGKKKVLHDVFERGDVWFRTGDLMRRDGDGYFYFVDRVGDTFRWKGENVSTLEVSETITAAPGVVESNVYGVKIPGSEGRAGMAALVIEPAFDLAAFRAHLTQRLPDYARPLFVRIQRQLDTTATFKQRKINLVREGFDPTAVSDRIYFNDQQSQSFIPVDPALYLRITAGEIRI